ncbi:diaminopimelate decarboxylase, partial [Streptococcus pyogenes]
RFMLAPHGHLVTKVLHIKDTYRRYVGVDATAANLMRPAFYGAYHHITNISNPDGPVEVVDVTGSLCENNDKFAKNRELPKVRLGDTLVI